MELGARGGGEAGGGVVESGGRDGCGLVLPHGLHLVCDDVGLGSGVAFDAVGACVGCFAVGEALCAGLGCLLGGVGGCSGAVDELTHFELRSTSCEFIVRGFGRWSRSSGRL